MRQAITLLLVFPFMVFFMFQPFMSEVVHMRGVLLEQTAHKYAKLAAREGYLSPELANLLRKELGQYHFRESDITLSESTSVKQTRGITVTVTLEYPMGSLFVFSGWFGSDSSVSEYRFDASEMSEYLP
ncbi:hypothetical protein [Gorillibacterium massiliense]|uniref:hypothetical protein n=1 Tax=Gorillibacterium massiliense TaxID=1280390 RepID=UPI0004AF0B9C|nr:hypothetical protein [Gorillibacterium massiliense]